MGTLPSAVIFRNYISLDSLYNYALMAKRLSDTYCGIISFRYLLSISTLNFYINPAQRRKQQGST